MKFDALLRQLAQSPLDEIEATVASLPPDVLQELQKAKDQETRDRLWMPNPGPQTDAYLSKADILLYGGQGGGGKGLRPDCPILTPFGWRAIGSLNVGDALCATDGTVTRVIGVYHRGIQPLYRLTFSDGSVIECDEDHIWQGWVAGKNRKIGNSRIGGASSVKKWVTKSIAKHYANGGKRIIIPVISSPAAFNVVGALKGKGNFLRRSIPPYVLGVLLGDGSVGQGKGIFTSADPSIAWRVAVDLGCEVSCYDYGKPAKTYRIPDAYIKDGLKSLGIDKCRAHEKFIPRIYLFGSVDERVALLQGLMDTDGWADPDGDAYFCTVSKQLANDVKHLARSLGAIVTVREKTPSYTHNGEKLKGRLAYTLRIKSDDPENLFFLPRKKQVVEGKCYQSMGLPLESIERCGEGETVCIAVEHPNSLFIADNFLVTHNTDLGLGLAFTAHTNSLLMRRKYTDLGGMIERAEAINGGGKGFNKSPPPKLRLDGGKLIEFGAAQHKGDEQSWQGRPHDLLYLDEAVQFLESQVRFLLGWLRSTKEGQRVRAVLGTNPPVTAEGDWIVKLFRPWLDLTHGKPAKPGELRYYVTAPDGSDLEVDGPVPIELPGADKPLIPMSRTFIPAALADNPFLINTGYQAKLDGLPEPLRSAVRDGNFMAARSDDDWQVIPTQWIIEAQARWKPDGRGDMQMTAAALDVGAGRDETVLACRHGAWFAELQTVKGDLARDPAHAASLAVRYRKDGCPIVVDVGGGFGGPALLMFKENGIDHASFNGANSSTAKTQDGKLGFYNKRAEAWWKMREELDPSQEGGSAIALPPDPQLRADLAAPLWKMTTRGILIEAKEEVKKRIGRSPDRGDAVVMCLSEGNLAAARRVRAQSLGGRRPQVIMNRRGR